MISALLSLVVYILVLGLIVWLLLYVLDQFPLPEPFHRVARVVIVVIAVLFLIVLLLDLVGGGNMGLPRFR
jgi:hypothetical protein